MLAKHNIKSVALPHRKIASYLPSFKEAIRLRTPGIYSIPCANAEVFILDRPAGLFNIASMSTADT